MSTFAIVVLVLAIGAIATFIAMKSGKVADVDNNNIPDAIEKPIKAAVAEVKEIVAKVEEIKATTKKPAAKTNAPKKTKK